MKTRSITEGALMATLTVITALISYYIPFFSIIAFFFLPLPTTILYKRQGGRVALIESIVSSLLLVLFMGPLNALFMGTNIIFPGLLIGNAYKKKKSGGYRIVCGYVAFLVTLMVEIIVTQLITNISFVESFLEELNQVSSTMLEVYKNSGVMNEESIGILTGELNSYLEIIKLAFPALVLLIPAFSSWITILIDDFFFKRLRLEYVPLESITDWYIPVPIKNALAITTVIVILFDNFVENENLLVYGFTVEILIFLLYIVMGYATVFWFIKYKLHSPAYWLRVIIVVLSLFFTFLIYLVLLLGLIDVFFNIRKYFGKRSSQ